MSGAADWDIEYATISGDSSRGGLFEPKELCGELMMQLWTKGGSAHWEPVWAEMNGHVIHVYTQKVRKHTITQHIFFFLSLFCCLFVCLFVVLFLFCLCLFCLCLCLFCFVFSFLFFVFFFFFSSWFFFSPSFSAMGQSCFCRVLAGGCKRANTCFV